MPFELVKYMVDPSKTRFWLIRTCHEWKLNKPRLLEKRCDINTGSFPIKTRIYCTLNLWNLFNYLLLYTSAKNDYLYEQLSRGVLRKRSSENVKEIYRRKLMPKCAFNKVGLQHLFIRTTLEDCFCTWDPEILLFFSLDPLFYNFSRSSNFSSHPNGQIKRNMAVQQNNSSNFFASNKINLLFPERLRNIFAGCKTCYTEIVSQNGMISPLFTHGQFDEEI